MAAKPISIIGYFIAFEAAQCGHNQLSLGARFQPLQFGGQRRLLLRIEQVRLIDNAARKRGEVLRKRCLTG